MLSHRLLSLPVVAALLALAAPARGEVIELLDKTKMSGKIIHYYDGVYTVETNNQTIKLPREKIRSISFQLPAARPEFSTPEKTFDRWRKAMSGRLLRAHVPRGARDADGPRERV